MTYAEHFGERGKTRQGESARRDQVPNSAGGFSFKVDCWSRLDRFLVLGAEGGSYYAGERELVLENAKAVQECLDTDPERTVARIVQISDEGRAPKNDAAVFALALACAHERANVHALRAVSKVCRIGTHLFQFMEAVTKFRGTGKGLQRAIGRWYSERDLHSLLVQVTKYQNRNKWSHGDCLRLAHRKLDQEHAAVYRWVLGAERGERVVKRKVTGTEVRYAAAGELPAYLAGFDELKRTTDPFQVVSLIREHGFTHEMVLSEAKKHVAVWEALLEKMPVHAMVRNLGKMTEVGLVKPMSVAAKTVARKLADGEALRKSRLHPMAVLLGMKQYATGHGDKGSLTWSPVREVIDALDGAFYECFKNVEPTGKRTLLALDISGSMGATIAGTNVSARVASSAMAMVTARVEEAWHAVGFTSGAPGEYKVGLGRSMHHGYSAGLTELKISSRQRLDDICEYTEKLPMGGTDCSLPMLYAMDRGLAVDVFHVYTDNETWAGDIHPFQALKKYRDKTGIPAKLVVVGMVANEFTIADPTDAGMLDVVGFDAAAPSIIANFARA